MDNGTWGWDQREGQEGGEGENEQVEGAGTGGEGGEDHIMLSGNFEGEKERDDIRQERHRNRAGQRDDECVVLERRSNLNRERAEKDN